jgi:DNA polymerase/3'-5' exonuclease PolX
VAQRLAHALADALATACARIEIAGSIRRGKAIVKDVELVCIPRAGELDALLARLERQGTEDGRRIYRSRQVLEEALAAQGQPFVHAPDVRRWGARYKRFYVYVNPRHGIVAVDLFLATRDNWGAIYTIRTGPGDFSQALVTHLKTRTPYRQQDGQVVVGATGAVVPVPEEADYFALAGLPVIPPERRTVAELRRALAEARRAGLRPAPPPDLPAGGGSEYACGVQLALPL